MKLVEVTPERIRLTLPREGTIYLTLGEGRDLLDELQKIYTQRVKEGKGLA